MITNNPKLEQLRLRCEFLLIAGEWQEALKCYDQMLEISQDPFIFTARAKILEHLERQPEAMENFESALRLTSQDELRTVHLLQLILGVDKDHGGLLKTLAKENISKFKISETIKDIGIAETMLANQENICESNDPSTFLNTTNSAHALNENKENDSTAATILNTGDSAQTILDSHDNDSTAATVLNTSNTEQTMLDSHDNDSTAATMISNNSEDTFSNSPPIEASLENNVTQLVDTNINSEQTYIADDVKPTEKKIIATTNARVPSANATQAKPSSSSETQQKTKQKNLNTTKQPEGQSNSPTRPYQGSSQQSNRIELGKQFGRYQILKKLGEGGMGIVYKVHDIEIGRMAALKVLRLQENIAAMQTQRFMQEVKATARLQHPAIITIYEFDIHPQPYFTMEFMSGKTLSACIHEEIFKPTKAARILKIIAEAIDCAHRAGIIHRDLKPGNIMMITDDQPKVMDFGLAKLEGEAGLSKTGDIMGTPAYMPPEQAQGGKTDNRSDIYSLGAIGYEMITGKPVFQGDNVFQILNMVIRYDPLRPSTINANVDIDLETILLKCLEKAPNKRYQTAMELADDLSRYLENRPILAKPPTIITRTTKWVRRNKERTVALFSLFGMIAGFIFYVYLTWNWQIRLNKMVGMLNDVGRWDLEKVDYKKHVEPVYVEAEKLAPCSFFYTNWGEFCMRYGQKNGQKDLQLKKDFYSLAEEKFQKAISEDQNDSAALYYLIIIAVGKNQYELAGIYNTMLENALKRTNTQHNEFYCIMKAKELAKEYTNENKDKIRKQQIDLLETAVRLNPQLFCAYNSLGELYLDAKDYDNAAISFERSIQANPSYRFAYANRAKLNMELFQLAMANQNSLMQKEKPVTEGGKAQNQEDSSNSELAMMYESDESETPSTKPILPPKIKPSTKEQPKIPTNQPKTTVAGNQRTTTATTGNQPKTTATGNQPKTTATQSQSRIEKFANRVHDTKETITSKIHDKKGELVEKIKNKKQELEATIKRRKEARKQRLIQIELAKQHVLKVKKDLEEAQKYLQEDQKSGQDSLKLKMQASKDLNSSLKLETAQSLPSLPQSPPGAASTSAYNNTMLSEQEQYQKWMSKLAEEEKKLQEAEQEEDDENLKED